jgi:hypothetical protein
VSPLIATLNPNESPAAPSEARILAICETSKYEEPVACVNLLPDERRADDDPSERAARATDPLSFVLGSERWPTPDDDDARACPAIVTAIALLSPPLEAPLCTLARLREVDVVDGVRVDSSVDVRGGKESGCPSASTNAFSEDPICTATRRRRRLSSGCTERRARWLLASRAEG